MCKRRSVCANSLHCVFTAFFSRENQVLKGRRPQHIRHVGGSGFESGFNGDNSMRFIKRETPDSIVAGGVYEQPYCKRSQSNFAF
jgi:hypothetical protein